MGLGNSGAPVSRRKGERFAFRGEAIGKGEDVNAVEQYVEYRDVVVARLGGHGLVERTRDAGNLVAEVLDHLFKEESDKCLVLHNQDAAAVVHLELPIPLVLPWSERASGGEVPAVDLGALPGGDLPMSSPVSRLAEDGRVSRRKPESLAKLKKAARRLFVERGYHATRPQDIAREAGLGHGTFYLHFPDKRACFLSFVEEARNELDAFVRARVAAHNTFEELIAGTLHAIYDYSEAHPGVLNAAMTDEVVIDAEGAQATPLLQRWGYDWAEVIRAAADHGHASIEYDPEIVGQAVVGAIHQAAAEGSRSGRSSQSVVANLTRFLVRALRP